MFESANLKIGRAQHHIADLERQFEAFVLRKPHRFSIKHDPDTGQPVIQIRVVEAVPECFAAIIGDAVHNLRSALDHMTWELIGWDGGAQSKHLAFPCRDNRVNFEAACNGLPARSDWIKTVFVDFGAFPDGRGKIFCTIHDMDIADKHRALKPVLRATTHPAFTIYHANGQPFIRMAGNRFLGGVSDVIPIVNVPNGGFVELDDNADCTPEIFLADVREEDAFTMLKRFEVSVMNALESVQSAVAQHPKN